MSEFKYQAINQKGKTVSGVIDATSERDARKKIRAAKLTLLKFTNVGGGNSRKDAKPKKTNGLFKGGVVRKGSAKGEKLGLEFLKRLNELHGSGMPVADSVKLLNLRLSDPYQKEIAGTLWRELAEGRTLSKAMRLLPQYFAESSTFVIEAGEATGNLTPILAKIIAHREEKREIRSKVVGSMTYPVFVGLVAIEMFCFFYFFFCLKFRICWIPLGES